MNSRNLERRDIVSDLYRLLLVFDVVYYVANEVEKKNIKAFIERIDLNSEK